MNSLPVEQRNALEMAFLHEKTHSEIAEQAGCPLGTVKTRARLALRFVRFAMQPLDA
jgi:RNA polymerase sigma-70 factor (ECF subfamily)